VSFHRKALGLVADLHKRFAQEDRRFDFPDMGALPADSGAAVAAALRARGVLALAPELQAQVEAGQELAAGEAERRIRAGAVAAAERVAAAAGGAFSGFELGCYLRALGEEAAGEAGTGAAAAPIRPHVTKSTAY
jgi:hypothetical protein